MKAQQKRKRAMDLLTDPRNLYYMPWSHDPLSHDGKTIEVITGEEGSFPLIDIDCIPLNWLASIVTMMHNERMHMIQLITSAAENGDLEPIRQKAADFNEEMVSTIKNLNFEVGKNG